jgi:hypothetical protein
MDGRQKGLLTDGERSHYANSLLIEAALILLLYNT